MTVEQLDLLAWGADNPQPEHRAFAKQKPSPPLVDVPDEPSRRFSAGEIVLVRRLFPDNKRESEADFYWAGTVLGYNKIGFVLVDIGTPGNPYPCPESRLTPYQGVVCLWRLGAATYCDRSDCSPKQKSQPFTCEICECKAKPWWWYVGDMAVEPVKPRWPDAMWFPAGWDPNVKEGPIVGG